MSQPLISICVAAANADKYLETALRSVGAQTYANWEIVVVEDGSSERTKTCVQDLAASVSQHVIYIHQEPNQGIPTIRNVGVAAASGGWIAFLDSDALWKPDHLATLISASEIEEPDLVFAGSTLFDDATWKKLGVRAPSDTDLNNLPLALFTGHLPIKAPAVMVKRESLGKYGPLSKEFSTCSETEYWLRMLSRGGRLCYSGANTCIYRQYSSHENKTATALAESARICELYAGITGISRRIGRTRTANLNRWAARSLLAEDPKAAREAIARALRLQPLNPKTIGLWARIFLWPKKQLSRTAKNIAS